MIELREILSTLTKRFHTRLNVRTHVIGIIEKELNITLNPKNLYIENRVISLSIHPIIKTEILLKKQRILLSCKEELGADVIIDLV